MTIPDLINGTFEALGGFLNWMNCWSLYTDKQVKGVYPLVWVFFSSWGIWNLYYYRHLDQFMSWYGGMFLVSANVAWIILATYYGAFNFIWTKFKEKYSNEEKMYL